MYCQQCGDPVPFDIREYAEKLDSRGNAQCSRCHTPRLKTEDNLLSHVFGNTQITRLPA